MNSIFVDLGLGSWKFLLTALVLPPVPLLAIALWGAWLLWTRRGIGWFMTWFAVAGLWLSNCVGVAEALERGLLRPPAGLSAERIAQFQRDPQARRAAAIVVLGGGREALAPEYRAASLNAYSLERLRYGVWLGRETGLPVGFAGGVGYAQEAGPPEAVIAARIAAAEYGRPLRWAEETSRDTRENAQRMVPMLDKAGIDEVLLVTHEWHMPRALRAFEEAGAGRLRVTPAPIALGPAIDRPLLRWLPSSEGHLLTRQVLREALGLWMGS